MTWTERIIGGSVGLGEGAWCCHYGALGIEVRSGIHTGECERHGDKLAGVAIHIGARIAGLAEPGEILVSSTVRDLVAGSGLTFEERGEHGLRGLPDAWRLYAVADA